MCRFTFYTGKPIRISSLVTEPNHSLINQSFQAKEREEPLNGDGFGLAWYSEENSDEPALFKSITPAWSNRNLFELARVIETGCVMAHVRAATQGFHVSENNCHPFKSGRFAFMHNGDIGGFANIRKTIIEGLSEKAFRHVHGSTDSEHFFGMFLDEVWKKTDPHSVLAMAEAMKQVITNITNLVSARCPGEYCYLNMVVTDGDHAVVVRSTTDPDLAADSLYMNYGKKYICEEGVCRMIDPGEADQSILVSSEPLSNDPGWEQLKVNQMVLIKNGQLLDKMEITL